MLVQELLESGQEAVLGGRRREVTILFSDIVSFTSISEKLSPYELVEELGEYLEAMSQVIEDEQGTVDKFIGDSIMAFWGAPHETDDHAVHACLAALKMQRRLGELIQGWERRGWPALLTRIGFAEAIEAFEQAAVLFGGEDGPSQAMSARCQEYEKNPPPSAWDGTSVKTSK